MASPSQKRRRVRLLIGIAGVCALSFAIISVMDRLGGDNGKNGAGSGGSGKPATGSSGTENTGANAAGGGTDNTNPASGNNSSNTSPNTGNPTSGGTPTPDNPGAGGVTQPFSEPLDKPPDASVNVPVVRTFIENFVRDHTMIEQVLISELSGNYFPPNTQLLAAHFHGLSVTMDFSTELLAFVNHPEIFDQWQQEVINGVFEIAPTIANFHVRTKDEKGVLRPLNDFLKIPSEKKPKDTVPQPPE
ncbi:MAG: hypothetical protein RDV41_02705 [Planctomycetota bacterium]|nr:hypothetical protein [Planctomycetota bacterium]